MTNTYNDMIAHAKAHNLDIEYNVPVKGTPFQLIAHIPAMNTAFVSGAHSKVQDQRTKVNDKMRAIKKVTGIKNLMVFISE